MDADPMNVLDTFQLQGRCALITGSAAGIGLALARALAHARARVLIFVQRKTS